MPAITIIATHTNGLILYASCIAGSIGIIIAIVGIKIATSINLHANIISIITNTGIPNDFTQPIDTKAVTTIDYIPLTPVSKGENDNYNRRGMAAGFTEGQIFQKYESEQEGVYKVEKMNIKENGGKEALVLKYYAKGSKDSTPITITNKDQNAVVLHSSTAPIVIPGVYDTGWTTAKPTHVLRVHS